MKARLENGTIRIYHAMPHSWNGVNYYAGDFHLQSDEVYIEEGFYNVVRPEFDPETEKLGAIFKDGNVYTYPVESLNLDLEDVKAQKRLELRELMARVQAAANPYLQRLEYLEQSPPQEFKTKTAQLYGLFDQHKAAINALTDWKAVVKYELPYDVAAAAEADLKKLI